MKKFVLILMILALGCKTKEIKFSSAKSTELPSSNVERSKEINLMNSINYSAIINSHNKLFVNQKEYPISAMKSIMDTIDRSKYTLEIKADTVAQIKSLILNTKK